MLTIHSESLVDYMCSRYSKKAVDRLSDYLHQHQTFSFIRLDNGLFPASGGSGDDLGGYENAWLRDNVTIAYAHFVWGEKDVAAQNAQALMRFVRSQRLRMEEIIRDPALAKNPMNRPHIRFQATTFHELDEHWPHAQNDALGYFLWFYCKLANASLLTLTVDDVETLCSLVRYLNAIQYWRDKDSGHWEEVLKVAASSIGAVVAGLREFTTLLHSGINAELPEDSELTRAIAANDKSHLSEIRALAELLEQKGVDALARILPCESIDPQPGYPRDYDAALLFLVYPLNVVNADMADRILENVAHYLQGSCGIRRYLGDSYRCADYRELFGEGDRSVDFSENIKRRDKYITEGGEALWCIFDPIMVCIYARRYIESRRDKDLIWATHYFNRCIGQVYENLDGDLLCPEAYFLEKGEYVPNDQLPLQWTQANLKMAFYWLGQCHLSATD